MLVTSYIAAILTTIAFLPQTLQVIRTRNTEGISLGMYIIYVTGVILWTIYGLTTGEYAVGIANAITLVFAGTILVYKLKNIRVKA